MIITLSLAVLSVLSAASPKFDKLNEAQRYDLAKAYALVADRFDELKQSERAKGYRQMAEKIFPGYKQSVPEPAEKAAKSVEPVDKPVALSTPGDTASIYYFNKVLKGVFTENLNLTLNTLADPLYLPQYDKGINKEYAASELQWAFDKYDLESMSPSDVFQMDTIQVTSLNNGYWRLDIQTQPGYGEAVPVTFWSEKMGFYFRKYSEGWRLAAIGPVQ